MTHAESAKVEARLIGWARTYYPALSAEQDPPNGLLLGFLVDRSGAVIAHTAALTDPNAKSLAADLARLFPGHSEKEFRQASAASFGMRPGDPRLRIEFATVSKER